MGMTRGVAIVADITTLRNLTGRQNLADLQADSELVVATFLITASDWVFDGLEGVGVDPTQITNEVIYERSAAAYAVALLAEGGYLGVEEDVSELFARAEREFARVRPSLPVGDEGASTLGAIPSVGNFEPGWVFGPRRSVPSSQRYWDNIPDSR